MAAIVTLRHCLWSGRRGRPQQTWEAGKSVPPEHASTAPQGRRGNATGRRQVFLPWIKADRVTHTPLRLAWYTVVSLSELTRGVTTVKDYLSCAEHDGVLWTGLMPAAWHKTFCR
jgi:hypothetical protein